mmetsp:Transcript_5200/g.6792  ORF Transcript_5200/g.6792 Transcript_5200/m.6792 type:complete len:518 (-) Transcript_5200:11-1564(-)
MKLGNVTEASCFFFTILIWLGGAFQHAEAAWGRPKQYRVIKRLRAGESDPRSDLVFRPTFLDDENEDANIITPEKILIVMDGFCPYHGSYLMRKAQDEKGVAVVPVLSEYLRNYLLVTEPEQADQWQSLRIPTTAEQAQEWMSHLPPNSQVVAIYCESDSGLEDAENLRKLLNVSCVDDPICSPARRDKYAMIEKVKEYGLATAQQKLCNSASDAIAFAQALLLERAGKTGRDPTRVVVKPFRGVASESVFLCISVQEVQEAWEFITDTTVFGAMSGAKHDTVLVQEFIEGSEYALDVVSRNGEHKIAAIWKYDKRPANGASFCYFRTKLVDASMEPRDVPLIQEYIRKALTALGVQYGLSHNEVIMTEDRGPVLVEINCRQHNMDFAPIAMACIGYNALDMTVDALMGSDGGVDDNMWDMYPDEPMLRAFGCMVHLVNFQKGVLLNVNHLDQISELPSFFKGEVYEKFQTIGAEIEPTVDIRSDAGWIQLLSEDHYELEEDYKQIVESMPTMFEVE